MSSKRNQRNRFRPTVEALEDRLTPVITSSNPFTIVGIDRGPPQVKVFAGDESREVASFFAFDPNFRGGVSVGIGDVNGDRVLDYICGAGVGAPGGHVIVVDGTRANQLLPNGQIADSALLANFLVFDPSVTSGVFVTGGNFDGDRFAEVAVGTGLDAVGRVRIFDVAGGRATRMAGPLGDFTPYGDGFLGGITLGAADVNRDGRDELITGMFRGGSRVKAFDANTGNAVRDFTAFGPGVDGVNVGGADIDGDGFDDIVTGSALGGRGRAKVFSGDSQGRHEDVLFNRLTMGRDFTGGIRIVGTQATPGQEAQVLTAPSAGSGSEIIITSAATGRRLGSFQPFGSDFNGGFFIASAEVVSQATTNLRIVGIDQGPPLVKVFGEGTQEVASFAAFDPSVGSGVRVGIGDGVQDYVLGAGPGGAARVKVVDGTKAHLLKPSGEIANRALLANFVALPGVHSGVFVTAGDFDGDGRAEVAVSAGTGTTGRVRVFDIVNGHARQDRGPLGNFLPYGRHFTGGITLAAADLDNDGDDELVTGTFRGSSLVKAFNGHTGAEVFREFALPGFQGGLSVAGGDIDRDGHDDIVIGGAEGAGGHLKAFSGRTSLVIADFFGMGDNFTGGTRVAISFTAFGTTVWAGPNPFTDAQSEPTTRGAVINSSNPFTGRIVSQITPFGADFQGGVFLANSR